MVQARGAVQVFGCTWGAGSLLSSAPLQPRVNNQKGTVYRRKPKEVNIQNALKNSSGFLKTILVTVHS